MTAAPLYPEFVFTHEENLELETGVLVDADLVREQIMLERKTREYGMDRYTKRMEKEKERNRESETSYGARLITTLTAKVAEGIKKFLEEGSVGRNHSSLTYLDQIRPESAAFLALKSILNGISRERKLQKVMIEIATAIEDEIRFSHLRDADTKYYDRVLKKGVKERLSDHNKRFYLVYCMNKREIEWDNWSEADKVKLGGKLLDIIQQTIGLVELFRKPEEKGETLYLRATEETLKWIAKRNDVMAFLGHTCEPMVVPPKPWTNPVNGGYLTSNIAPKTLVKTPNKTYLKQLADVEMPNVYKAINAVQNTPWVINRRVLRVMNYMWDNDRDFGVLPRKKDYELPELPHDFKTNPEAKKNWKNVAKEIHKKNNKVASKRLQFDINLQTARKYSHYSAIYFPYQVDFRGRVYAIPSFNPQGTDYIKSLLRLQNAKPLGEHGAKWLAIHGANCAGVDKVTFEERIAWVHEHTEEILASAADPMGCKWWMDQDSPWQFLAFCFEWAGYKKFGDGYICGIPVALDGSCSGIQHYSAMLRDEIGGAAVNLLPADRPQDIYKRVSDRVNESLKRLAKNGTEDEYTLEKAEDGTEYQKIKRGTKNLAKQWLQFGVDRKVTKRSVMTLPYGSRAYGFRDQLMEDIINPARGEEKNFPFDGSGYVAAGFMANQIWEAVQSVVVKAAQAMEWLKKAAALVAKEGLPIRWVTPAGFPVLQDYRDMKNRRIETKLNGARIVLSIAEAEDSISRTAMANAISPNFIHSCDAAHLMLTVCACVDEGVTDFALIHDSFGTVPADTETLFRVVRETMVDMYSQLSVLEHFAEQLKYQLTEDNVKLLPELPSHGTLQLEAIIESLYCFA